MRAGDPKRRQGRLASSFHFALPLLLFLLLSLSLPAQDALLKKADGLYREMNYDQAIKAYTKYFKKNPPRKKPLANLADCYRITFQYQKAADTYKALIEMPRPEPIHFYEYGKSLMNLEQYEEAQQWFLKFAEQQPEDPRGMAMADACANTDRFQKDSAYYSVLPLPINTKESEFAPSFWGDGIVFTASRPQTTLDASDYDWNTQSFLDLYFSRITPDGNGFSKPKPLDGSVNTPYHEATATFDRAGKTVYFTRNNFVEGVSATDEQGLNRLQIYYADLDNGEWQDIKGLPFNSNKYSVGHPCLSEQGNILYFVSDMPGGYGGTDLYLSYRRDDAWSQPVNLGPTINTAGNEMFPFIHEDRTLYFSSDGHPGLGGLDLFTAEFDTTWRRIRNLGYPFNTAADDFALIITDEKDQGYFSSNRPGGKGLDDLYRFRVLLPLLTGVVVNAEDGQPIADAKVSVYVSGTEEQKVIYTSPEGKFSQLLRYDEDYRVVVEHNGHLQEVVQVSTLQLKGPERQNVVVTLKTAPKRIGGQLVEPTTGDPIIDAQVRILGMDGGTRTDSLGRFQLFVDPSQKPGYRAYEPDENDCRMVTPGNLCYNFGPNDQEFALLKPGTQFRWDFGDGTTGRGTDVQHCYRHAGKYRVRLQLIEERTGSLLQEVSTYDFGVTDVPRATFESPDKVERGSLATFDATDSRIPDCHITDYFWTYGDGFTGFGANAVHVYEHAGVYKVKLELTGRGNEPGTFCNACVYRMITVMPRATDATDYVEATVAPEPLPSADGCQEEQPEGYCFSFFDPRNRRPTGDTTYLWHFGDGDFAEGERTQHCYTSPGAYLVRMTLTDKSTQSHHYGEVAFQLHVRDTGNLMVRAPLRLAAGQVGVFAKGPAVPQGSNVATQWDFGDGTTVAGEEVQHIYHESGVYKVSLRTESERDMQRQCHTQLVEVMHGLVPADSIALTGIQKAYLDPSQIFYLEITKQGYVTQLVPVTPEALAGDLPLSIESSLDPSAILLEGTVADDSMNVLLNEAVVRVKNRSTGRIQTLVTGQMGSFSIFLEPETEYELTAEKGGFLSASAQVSTLGWTQDARRLNERIRLRRIDYSKTFVLRHIYFGFNSAEVMPESREELLKLVQFLKDNSGVSIEVGAHTDARGNDDYNLVLSQARATAVTSFLTDNGIAASRLQSMGYGEQRPVNQCTNGVECTPEQHRQNRRTEFRILGSKDPLYTEATADGTAIMLNSPIPTSNTSLSDTGVVYSVQVGLFKDPDPTKVAANLGDYRKDLRTEKVNAFTRFRIGYYADFEAAKRHLARLQSQGYPDAFLVAVPLTQVKGPVTPSVSVKPLGRDTVSTPSIKPSNGTPSTTRVVPGLVYKVQLGTFTSEPQQGYFDRLEIWRRSLTAELFDNGKRYMIGPFSSLTAAQDALDDLQRKGFNEAGIVAYYKYRKISLEEAGRL